MQVSHSRRAQARIMGFLQLEIQLKVCPQELIHEHELLDMQTAGMVDSADVK